MGNYTEKELRETLGREMTVSDEVNERLEQVYGQIKSGKAKKRRRYTAWYRAGGTAAAVVAAGIFCVSNPAIAAKLPFIGHIFEEIGEEASYPGDYSQVGTPLMEESELLSQETDGAEGQSGTAAEAASAAYVQESDGITMTLSEVYCNDIALYLTMELKSEEPFADYMEDSNGEPILALRGNVLYDFNNEEKHFHEYLDGKLVDEHTYIGMLRMDLRDAKVDNSELRKAIDEMYGGDKPENDAQIYEAGLIKEVKLPEEFKAKFQITQIIGDREDPMTIYEAAGVEQPSEEELLAMSDEEWSEYMEGLYNSVPEYNQYPNQYENYWYDGPFHFDIDVKLDQERTVTVPVETGADGEYYIESVTKSPFELYINQVGTEMAGGVLVVLDADGKRMDTGARGGYEDVLSVEGHNLSKIDIYSIDWDLWESLRIKGSYFDTHDTDENGKTMKELLDENSMYHKEVVLE